MKKSKTKKMKSKKSNMVDNYFNDEEDEYE